MEQETTIERRFDVAGPARLSLANIGGSVDIQPGDDGAILVIAEKDARHSNAERTQIEMTQAADGSVTVKTDYLESFWRWFGQSPCDVDYTVRVPRNCAVQLKCVTSRSSVKGLSGRLDLSSVSGDLAIADLSGVLKVNCVSGGLSGERLSGSADVETVSGRVELRASNFESARVSTVSGAVAIETPLGNGPYKFHSVSGDVRLAVQADARGTIEATSLSGRVHADLPVTRSEKSGQRWHVELQGGGPAIHFDSISGNLRVERSAAEAPATTPTAVAESFGVMAEAPAAPNVAGGGAPDAAIDQAANTRREILDRVSRGELSVDEAINVLRG